MPWIWEQDAEERRVSAGAAAPVQVLEKPKLGAGEQQPARPVSPAGMAALDVLTERGLGLIGAVLWWGLSSVPPDWAAETDRTFWP